MTLSVCQLDRCSLLRNVSLCDFKPPPFPEFEGFSKSVIERAKNLEGYKDYKRLCLNGITTSAIPITNTPPTGAPVTTPPSTTTEHVTTRTTSTWLTSSLLSTTDNINVSTVTPFEPETQLTSSATGHWPIYVFVTLAVIVAIVIITIIIIRRVRKGKTRERKDSQNKGDSAKPLISGSSHPVSMEVHENINYLNNKAERGEKWNGHRKDKNGSACADLDIDKGGYHSNQARNLIYEEIVDVPLKPEPKKRGSQDSKIFEVRNSMFQPEGFENKAFAKEENNLNEFPRKKLQSPKNFGLDTNFDFKNNFFNEYKPLADLDEDDYSKIHGDSDSDDKEEHIYMEPNPLPPVLKYRSKTDQNLEDDHRESVYANVSNKTTRPPSDLDLSDYDNLALYKREDFFSNKNRLSPLRTSDGYTQPSRPVSANSTDGLIPVKGIGKKPVPAVRKKKKPVLKKLSEEKHNTHA